MRASTVVADDGFYDVPAEEQKRARSGAEMEAGR
jgi:hypothetical protein